MQEMHLDRSSLKRSDQSWLTEEFCSDNSRIIPIFNSLVFCTENTEAPKPLILTYQEGKSFFNSKEMPIFLGRNGQNSYFAIEILSEKKASVLSSQHKASFQELRSVMSLVDSFSADLLSLAGFMIFWHSKNQFCGKCGSHTSVAEAGHLRTCDNDACNERYYPNMDPAIIVLVTSGDRCLLGRQKEWQEGVYSTLAGFVEPGEAIEDAVVREIQEEAGILVADIHYKHSQPWLFPNSLMLGFTAIAQEDKITINEDELEDIRWFTKAEIENDTNILPYKTSIAYQLITEWLSAS